ncbi:alpha/beta-hydrolase [Auricularia subglabra TFB-10046 SS5]|uniref:Alpha/beta-hydrolase n=1 Tax=Auricularia subglabra (strain TFB-10046 / SS5) TaxID=717982 RepID=J0WQI1_AURST|nr:alpha/beta-hydrolase [Auricularia subglabra TFB-10046 SS5]
MTLAQFEDKYGGYYKTHTTSRGLQYRFLHVPASAPHGTTLLWLHGFPSSIYEWHYQLDHFHAKGFGLVAPDMLGYGGTDKPTDAAQYTRSAMARDVLDIVESLHLAKKPVAIAHDWGAGLLGRVVDLYADKFAAFAFFNVGYIPAMPVPFNLDAMLVYLKNTTGKEGLAYWEFFTKDSADKVIEQNFESFLDLLHPADNLQVWGDILMERGQTEAFIKENRRIPRAKYITDEEYEAMRGHLIGEGRGLCTPLNWYAANVYGHNDADDIALSKQPKTTASQPVFYAACDQDAVCHPARALPGMRDFAKDLTVGEFTAGHWVYLEVPDKLNAELDKWIESKVLAQA